MINVVTWLLPTLGGHTWFEKPALLYWIMIGAFRLFGTLKRLRDSVGTLWFANYRRVSGLVECC